MTLETIERMMSYSHKPMSAMPNAGLPSRVEGRTIYLSSPEYMAQYARRFLWANTEVGGDSLEYTGTAMELFLGFLMAVALLVPVYVLLFIGTLELGMVSRFSSPVAFLILTVFGQYAYYRARRYRLTRTVFRGIRFHQSGSPWSYALRSLLWWIAIAYVADDCRSDDDGLSAGRARAIPPNLWSNQTCFSFSSTYQRPRPSPGNPCGRTGLATPARERCARYG